MRDLAHSVIFILCQTALLGLVTSPLWLGKGNTRTPAGRLKAGFYIVPAIILLVTAVVDISRAEYQLDYPRMGSLEAQVLAGKEIAVRLYPETCAVFDLGSLACGAEYRGRYERGKRTWTMTGPDKKSGATITATGVDTETVPGSLNLWGILAKFDANGTIFYIGQGVGTLRVTESARPS